MKCVKCGREKAVLTLPYNGQALGAKCFTDFFEKRVRRTIRSGEMLRYDDTIIVKAQGGVSSQVLLYLLARFASRHKKSRLIAVKVGDVGANNIEKLCKGLSVGLESASSGKYFTRTAKRLGAGKIVVCANLDDEVEEALSDFLEGKNRKIRREAIPVVRPLRECPIEEIKAYAELKKIPYIPIKRKTSREWKIICDLEKTHPGVRFQILASQDTLKRLTSQ
ncbi:MAG: hypothetical protein ABH851_09115 [Methanobacteriota archaeon]